MYVIDIFFTLKLIILVYYHADLCLVVKTPIKLARVFEICTNVQYIYEF